MLLPNRMKHRKVRKGKIRGVATSGNYIAFGDYALQSQSQERITSRQIEAARQAMTRYIKRGGKIWIRILPNSVKFSFAEASIRFASVARFSMSASICSFAILTGNSAIVVKQTISAISFWKLNANGTVTGHYLQKVKKRLRLIMR